MNINNVNVMHVICVGTGFQQRHFLHDMSAEEVVKLYADAALIR